jgi:aspartyl/asparaginyl beta-hydroxylase (cupin superfamily)
MSSIAELESRALALSEQGDMTATMQVCQEILAIDENHLSTRRFLADMALQSGDLAAATDHLRSLQANSPGDLQVLAQLGQALYDQGQLEQAVRAYTDYWRIKPSILIYLKLGCLHLELGNIDKAVQVFSLGEATDPKLLALWKNPETNPAVAAMSKTGWEALCRHHTELHVKTVEALGEPGKTTRIRDAIWPLIDTRPINYEHPQQRAQILSIKYDASPTFFDTNIFPWCEQLELNYPDIRQEILEGMNVAADGKPYLRNSHRLDGPQWEALVNKMSWASIHLYSRGKANQGVIDKFPKTLKALAQLPLAITNGNPSEVFISVLAPRTRIPEHFGVSSAIVTAHLPIEVPEGCGLKVHKETRVPEAGKLMVFDDTWEHSAWNNSDQPRVVLIFELWHPDLSELEKDAITRSIEAREYWFKQRAVD